MLPSSPFQGMRALRFCRKVACGHTSELYLSRILCRSDKSTTTVRYDGLYHVRGATMKEMQFSTSVHELLWLPQWLIVRTSYYTAPSRLHAANDLTCPKLTYNYVFTELLLIRLRLDRRTVRERGSIPRRYRLGSTTQYNMVDLRPSSPRPLHILYVVQALRPGVSRTFCPSHSQ